jgi:rare lipoprotein A (peptidoglycan hydrolase)
MAAIALRVFPGVLVSMLLATPVLAAPAQDNIDIAKKERSVEHRRPGGASRHKIALKSPPSKAGGVRVSQASPRRRSPATADGHAVVSHAFVSHAVVNHVTAMIDDSGIAPGAPGWSQTGVASWYGGDRWQGHMTSSGVRYDQDALTAAHATLPLGSHVRVSLPDSDRAVVVVITDRPGTRKRIIDLSRGAASALGILSRGVATVTLTPG